MDAAALVDWSRAALRHTDAPRYASAVDAARACVWALGALAKGASVQSGQMEGKR